MIINERKALALLATILTQGCHSRGTASTATAANLEPPPLERFALSVSASGSLKPGQPVTIHASALGVIDTRSADIVVYAPEVSAARARNSPKAANRISEALRPEAVWQTSLPAGERFDRQTSLLIPAPGYYRLIVSALKTSSEADEFRGRPVADVAHTELWLWVADTGGRVTRDFDRNLFPRAVRKQPGAFCLETSSSCEKLTEQQARISGWFANIPSLMRVRVSRGGPEPKIVRGARYDISISDHDSTRVFATTDSSFWSREYRISSARDLHIRVIVSGETPYVRGEANATIPLRPDLYLWVFVYAWSPSTDPRLYGCRCPGRAGSPLRGDAPLQDSIIIAWEVQSRSRPSPIGE
jgi:hypothetical protein